MREVKRYKMPWLDDPFEWPRELRKPGTGIVLASDYDALRAELEQQRRHHEARDDANMREFNALRAENKRLRWALRLLVAKLGPAYQAAWTLYGI